MSGRELVGALIRAAGLLLVGMAVVAAAYAGMSTVGAPVPPGYSAERALFSAGLYALIGCVMIAFAPELTAFAYLRDAAARGPGAKRGP